MITKDKLKELRGRIYKHKVVNGFAIVELTARELQTLVEAVDPTICTQCEGYGYDRGVFTLRPGGMCSLQGKGHGAPFVVEEDLWMKESTYSMLGFIGLCAIVFTPLTMFGNAARDREERHTQVRINECKAKGGTFFTSENMCVDAVRIRLSDDNLNDNR